MIKRDMPEVLDIENSTFDYPWSKEDFINALGHRSCIGLVAEDKGKIVGFIIYELQKQKLHILNIATHRDYRRMGVGKAILNKLHSKLSSSRKNRLIVKVRESNLPAQLFFRSFGFRAISIIKDFYEDTADDAYLMEYRYTEQEPNEESVDEVFSNGG
jgi:ribosomal-protein-alanine N-acetyltransferase